VSTPTPGFSFEISILSDIHVFEYFQRYQHLAFPVSTAIQINSHILWETSFELAVVENFVFTAENAIIGLLRLKRINHY